MRAIQFKAKVIEPKNGVPLATSAPVGTWVFGDLHFFHRVPHIHHNGGSRSAIDIETICQYTGLHDKKARDIYEGDIVQWDKDQKLYVVEFRNGMFYASVEPCNPRVYGGFPLWFLCEEDQHCSIVGNRFDNKELLKEGGTMKILKTMDFKEQQPEKRHVQESSVYDGPEGVWDNR